MNNDRIMSTKYVNVFVLGAGASVDYGLPVWAQLRELLIEDIKKNGLSEFPPGVANRFLNELEQIGPGKKYETVDEVISNFEDDEAEIPETTVEIFEVVKQVFMSRVMTENVGWIETFVKKNNLESLLNNEVSNFPTFFINFNYDTLLLSKFVQFFKHKCKNASKSEIKQWRLQHGADSDFEEKFEDWAKNIFHPHGILYLCESGELRIGRKTSCHPTSKTFRNARTRGASLAVSRTNIGVDNAISCHDAQEHFTFSDIKSRIHNLPGSGQRNAEMRLILLGVGPDSLAFNLDKFIGEKAFDIRQVYYTCTKEDDKHVYEQYLNMFEAATESYEDCQELVEKNTFIPFN